MQVYTITEHDVENNDSLPWNKVFATLEAAKAAFKEECDRSAREIAEDDGEEPVFETLEWRQEENQWFVNFGYDSLGIITLAELA